MAQRDLLDAFNDCIDRLATGQPLDAVLRQYPQYADKLSEMLRVAATARTAVHVPEAELAAARERVRLNVLNALADAPPYRPALALVPRVRRVLAAAAVLLIAGFVVALLLMNRQQQFAVIESLTPPSPTPSATATHTETVAPSETPTASPSPSATASISPSPIATETASPSPSATTTPSLTATVSPTVSATLTIGASPTVNPSGCVPTQPEEWVTYRIRSGDTLSRLASATGTTIQRLIDVNCIENPSLLVVGRSIFLPVTPTFVAPSATASGSVPVVPTSGGPVYPTATDDNSGHDDDDDDDDDGGHDDDDDDDDDDD